MGSEMCIRDRDADVFVTRGLGGMVRILNRPEVAVVILRRN